VLILIPYIEVYLRSVEELLCNYIEISCMHHVAVEAPLRNLDNAIDNAFNGWLTPGSGVDWSVVTQQNLEQFQRDVIDHGIEPLFRDLFGDDEGNLPQQIQSRLDNVAGNVKIFSRDEFALRSWYNAEMHDGNHNNNPAATGLQMIRIYAAQQGVLEADIVDAYGGPQGQAFGGFQTINAGSASPEQGLHLLIHETMHDLTDPNYQATLRLQQLGEECVNEFFARLATQYFKNSEFVNSPAGQGYQNMIGSPNGGVTPGTAANLYATEGRGVYGDLMMSEGYVPINGQMEAEQLRAFADQYFRDGDVSAARLAETMGWVPRDVADQAIHEALGETSLSLRDNIEALLWSKLSNDDEFIQLTPQQQHDYVRTLSDQMIDAQIERAVDATLLQNVDRVKLMFPDLAMGTDEFNSRLENEFILDLDFTNQNCNGTFWGNVIR
jgi:hypothetical protein